MTVKWHTDEASRRLHAILQDELSRIVARLCPAHELSHLGINRNFDTNEVVLKLHLNPIGRVKVAGAAEGGVSPRLER